MIFFAIWLLIETWQTVSVHDDDDDDDDDDARPHAKPAHNNMESLEYDDDDDNDNPIST